MLSFLSSLFGAKIAFAQAFSRVQENAPLKTIINNIANAIVIPLIEGLFAVAIVIFIWGLFGLISKGDEPEARKEGQKHILWGIIGIFIMVSVYGIIRLIGNTVGVGDPFR